MSRSLLLAGTALLGLSAASEGVSQTVLTLNNGVIESSLCVGGDCGTGISFGFDTIILRENNLRIFFDDTSTTGSFPPNDWRIRINDSSNGGDSYFGVEDATAGRTPFRVEAGARNHALFVDSQGDVGIGTSTPATDIDIKIGDTPTLRLQQDGTSGFTPQTWDVAGNEAGFFIRDATGGSQLSLRIRPGAPSSSLDISGDGLIGIGTGSPAALVHMERGGAGNDGLPRIYFENTDAPENWVMDVNDNALFRISVDGSGAQELTLDTSGDLTITGGLVTTGGGGACTGADPCDAVFDPDVYTVPTMEDYAAEMWQNGYLPAVGPTSPDAPINMTVKMLRMLNALEHAHIYIDQLNAHIKVQDARIDALEARVAQD